MILVDRSRDTLSGALALVFTSLSIVLALASVAAQNVASRFGSSVMRIYARRSPDRWVIAAFAFSATFILTEQLQPRRLDPDGPAPVAGLALSVIFLVITASLVIWCISTIVRWFRIDRAVAGVMKVTREAAGRVTRHRRAFAPETIPERPNHAPDVPAPRQGHLAEIDTDVAYEKCRRLDAIVVITERLGAAVVAGQAIGWIASRDPDGVLWPERGSSMSSTSPALASSGRASSTASSVSSTWRSWRFPRGQRSQLRARGHRGDELPVPGPPRRAARAVFGARRRELAARRRQRLDLRPAHRAGDDADRPVRHHRPTGCPSAPPVRELAPASSSSPRKSGCRTPPSRRRATRTRPSRQKSRGQTRCNGGAIPIAGTTDGHTVTDIVASRTSATLEHVCRTNVTMSAGASNVARSVPSAGVSSQKPGMYSSPPYTPSSFIPSASVDPPGDPDHLRRRRRPRRLLQRFVPRHRDDGPTAAEQPGLLSARQRPHGLSRSAERRRPDLRSVPADAGGRSDAVHAAHPTLRGAFRSVVDGFSPYTDR
jgi:hypothetical protein